MTSWKLIEIICDSILDFLACPYNTEKVEKYKFVYLRFIKALRADFE